MSHFYQVNYFGMLAERRGISQESVTSCATTAADLYSELDAAHRLGLAIGDLRAVVNDELIAWDHPLADGDRVAFLPPMSGG